MTALHAGVRVVEDRRLDAAAEQLVRLTHEELVESVLRGDEHGETVAAAPCAPPLLSQRRNRPREADRDHTVEQPDVDSELERVRRRHAEQVAVFQPPLDLASLRGRVAGPVGREPAVVPESLGREAVDELRGLAALRERQRPQPALDEQRLQAGSFGECRAAKAQLGVEQRRIPEHDRSLGASGSVRADHGDRLADQRRSELAWIGGRRRRQDELRLCSVEPSRSPEPAEHVRHVRAEDAAVDVRFVDDDVTQVGEHVAPTVVIRQNAHVNHVRVRQDRVGPAADLSPVLDGSVAVVDGRLETR